MKIQKVFKPVSEFEEIDITKALTTTGRVFYPKIARKTRIDDFLARRTHLKLLEERRLSQSEKLKEMANRLTSQKNDEEAADIDIENTEDPAGGNAALQNILSGKPANKTLNTGAAAVLAAIGKRIQQVRAQYSNLMRLGGKNASCYSRYCNAAAQNSLNKPLTSQSLVTNCYSPMCLKKLHLKRDLVMLLRKANALNNSHTTMVNAVATDPPATVKKEASADTKNNVIKTEADAPAAPAAVPPTAVPVDKCAEEKPVNDIRAEGDSTTPQDAAGDEPDAKRIKLEAVRINLDIF